MRKVNSVLDISSHLIAAWKFTLLRWLKLVFTQMESHRLSCLEVFAALVTLKYNKLKNCLVQERCYLSGPLSAILFLVRMSRLLS